MHIKNRVFESFLDFISSDHIQINESKNPLDLEDILEFMESLMGKQKDLLNKSKEFRKSFGESKDPEEGLEKYVKILRDKDSMNRSLEDYKEHIKNDEGLFRKVSVRYAVSIWDDLEIEEKTELAKSLLREAKTKGFKNPGDLRKIVKEKEAIAKKPYIGAMPAIYNEQKEIKKQPIKEMVLDKKAEGSFFKDNMYKMEDASFASEDVKDELIKHMTKILSLMNTDLYELDSIEIQSSASRFRNSMEPQISWGELSYERSRTLAKIINEIAKGLGFDEEQLESLRDKITLDFYGSNGDGTSGPNPPEGLRFGYYNEDDEFIEGNEREEVIVYSLDDKGKPIKELEIKKMSPLNDGEDYKDFRYVNILIKGAEPSSKSPQDLSSESEDNDRILIASIPYENYEDSKVKRKPGIPRNPRTGKSRSINPTKCAAFD